MKQNTFWITLCLAFLCCFSLNAQQNTFNFFKAKKHFSSPVVSKSYILTIKQNEYETFLQQTPNNFELTIPISKKQNISLKLEKNDILTNNFVLKELNEQGETTVPYKKGFYCKGTVIGSPQSTVAISFFDTEVIAVISTPKGNFVIGQYDSAGFKGRKYYKRKKIPAHIIYNDKDLLITNDFKCDVDGATAQMQPQKKKLYHPFQKSMTNSVDIYFECDYEMYLDNGSNINSTGNYVTGLFNVVATLYSNASITVQISQTSVWTTSDPYSSANSLDALHDFGDAKQNNFNGDLAHLLSTSNNNNGGRAWIDALCSTYNSWNHYGPYAYSNIGTSYNNNSVPTYSWTTMVVAHEMGHNLGSRHTHDCVWNGNNTQIDDCGNVSASSPNSCYSSSSAIIPSNGGTIMSYCHNQSVGINFAHGFHTQVTAVMQNAVNSASCLNPTSGTLSYNDQLVKDGIGGGSGDSDGLAEPGESIDLEVELLNNSSTNATNVSAILSTNDSDINITDDYQAWGTITAGNTDWTSDYDFDVSSTCPDKDVTFTLDITSDQGNWTETFIVHIYGSGVSTTLVYSSHTIDDDNSGGSIGNGNGQAEPGESIELPVELQNTGAADATNVAGILSTNDPDITITDDDRTWGTITAGSTDWTSDFDFDVSSTCPDKDVTFTLDITSDQGNWTETFIVHIYGGSSSCNTTITSYPYTEGFESGFGSWQQGAGDDIDWTQKTGSTSSSGTGPTSAHGGTNYIYTEATGSGTGFPNKVAELYSPCFNLNALSTPEISFWYHMYGTAMGTLELQVSTNNGTSWSSAIWSKTGNQGNQWTQATVDLSSYSGTIMLRFEGTTGSNYTSDMAIDDIRLGNSTPSSILNTSISSKNISSTGSSFTFGITSNVSWTVSDNASWLSTNLTSGSNNGTITVNYNSNTSASSRSATITVTGGGITKTIQVTQAGTSSTPPFTWTPTNQSGVFQGQAQVSGISATANDWIAAFDPNGNCAGAAQILVSGGIAYINLPIYADDPTTPNVDEGINGNEYFTLQLYDASAGVYRDYPNSSAKYQFTQWANTSGTPMSAYNDPTVIYNFVETTFDYVILYPGWNLISIDVAPSDSSITTIFADQITDNNLIYVTGFNNGSVFYDPNGLPFFNTLNDITRGAGYWVKVNVLDTLIAQGDAIPATYKKPLNAGWNLVGYMPQSPISVPSHFPTTISNGNLIYVTSFENGSVFYDPNGLPFFNTLTTMKNGYGYWVKVNTATSTYRNTLGGVSNSFTPAELLDDSPLNHIRPNNIYDFLNGTSNLQDYAGRFVTIKTEDGEICGQLEILTDGYLMTTSVYGDDLATLEKDGVTIGTKLLFEFEGQTLDKSIIFDGTMQLHQLNLEFDNLPKIENEAILNCYPNPFTTQLLIDYKLDGVINGQVKLHNSFGHLVKVFHLNENTPDQLLWSVEKETNGVYFISLEVNNKIITTQKVILKN